MTAEAMTIYMAGLGDLTLPGQPFEFQDVKLRLREDPTYRAWLDRMVSVEALPPARVDDLP